MSQKLSALSVAILLIFLSSFVSAQTLEDKLPAVRTSAYQPTILVDCPTAGTLKRGSFNAVMRVYPKGGILTSTNIGLSNRLMVGIGYGAEGVIAEEPPNWNPQIEFNVKLSLIDENLVLPAASIGFSSQGFGSYNDEFNRYTFKSKGFYLVGSKNYPFYNLQVGIHGGVNYSTEKDDMDDNLDFFLGFDTMLNQDVSLILEYDFATNDNRDGTSLGRGDGYINLALQWIYADNLVMEVLLKNLNNNRKGKSDIWRGLRVTYVEHF